MLEALQSDHFAAEVHHLLWLSPNMRQHRRDEGLNCRDHAYVVGTLLTEPGREVSIHTGGLVIVSGPREYQRGMLVVFKKHSWLSIDTLKPIDFSVRIPRQEIPDWRLWNLEYVWNGVAQPGDPSVSVHAHTDGHEWKINIENLQEVPGIRAVTYWTEERVPSSSLKSEGVLRWIDSPLGVEMNRATNGDSDIYLKIVEHLRKFLLREAPSLQSIPQEIAWKRISQSY
jgi:hypothetical protein